MRFLLLALLLLSSSARAQTDIHTICQSQFALCLLQIPKELEKTGSNKLLEASYTIYQLNALFNLGRYIELKQKTSELITTVDTLPTMLQLKVYIYHAKMLASDSNFEETEQYLRKAKVLFQQILASGSHVSMLIDFANLHIYTKEYEEGIQLLEELAERHRERPNAQIKSRIHLNLGNLRMHLNAYAGAQREYEKALHYAHEANIEAQVLLSSYNLARSFQEQEHDIRAINLFQQVLRESTRLRRPSVISLTHFRLGQLFSRRQQWQQVVFHLEQVLPVELNDGFKDERETMYTQANTELIRLSQRTPDTQGLGGGSQ